MSASPFCLDIHADVGDSIHILANHFSFAADQQLVAVAHRGNEEEEQAASR